MNENILNFRKELQNLGYSESVINNYPKYIKKLLIFSKENPEKITSQNIQNYHEYLQTKRKKRRKIERKLHLQQFISHKNIL